MLTALIVSQILLWSTLIALGGLVFALMRQIGVLHERIAPAGALAINKQVKVGDLAPKLIAKSLAGPEISIGDRSDIGRSRLVFFLSPDCPVCKSLLPVVASLGKAERKWLDVTYASDGEESAQIAFAAKHDLPRDQYVLSEALGRGLGVARLPYAVLIDEEGKIAAMGIVNSREHLESLFEAKEKKVASLQEYMKARQTPAADPALETKGVSIGKV